VCQAPAARRSAGGDGRRLAQADLQQYANDQRRSELPTRLFRRLDQLLHNRPERFTIMLASRERGSTCWMLTERPATAVFSERDGELVSQVLAVALTTLDETPDARKQSQFLSKAELERYAFEMLERSARGLTLDQLVRGLVLAYGLQATFEELPAEDELGTGAAVAERHGIPTLDPPEAPIEAHSAAAAQTMLARLTTRQRGVLKMLLDGIDNQREIASTLHCSPATISNELQTIRAAIEAAAPREEQAELLLAAGNLLGDGYEL
jgi:DNA-binding NarL/FixJ family response regulator